MDCPIQSYLPWGWHPRAHVFLFMLLASLSAPHLVCTRVVYVVLVYEA